MKKLFCDICGEPAVENLPTDHKVKHGKPYTGFKSERGCDGSWQCQIRVSVNFSFVEHPSGFGGPPDLCARCAAELTVNLAARIDPKTAGQTVRKARRAKT